MIRRNLSNYNLLGPLPTLPASASQGDVNKLVHRIVEIGAEMVTSGTSTSSETALTSSKISPNLRSKPSLHALMVTMGRHGFVIVRRTTNSESDEPLLPQTSQPTDPVVGLHFGSPSTDNGGIVSVSGAGDCLASGFLFGAVSGFGVKTCAALANAVAKASLQSVATVPSSVSSIRDTDIHVIEPSFVYLKP